MCKYLQGKEGKQIYSLDGVHNPSAEQQVTV